MVTAYIAALHGLPVAEALARVQAGRRMARTLTPTLALTLALTLTQFTAEAAVDSVLEGNFIGGQAHTTLP